MLETRHAIIDRLRQKARKIAAHKPLADFYRDFPHESALSGHQFNNDAVVCRLRAVVSEAIEDDYGHGLDHAIKVALDAGALVAIEGQQAGFSREFITGHIRMAHCAGLLHDIERRKKDHARLGAIYARQVLADYPFTKKEVSDIATAIANHEAFCSPLEMPTVTARMLSDCVYDSDKFRFGPDNFTHTVWDMVEGSGIALDRFVARYPEGIAFLEKIKHTFRSQTGRKYGPQFIDIGVAIGEELYRYMKTELKL